MPGKRIEVDEDTLLKLTDLGRRRMATFQELIDEALADLMNNPVSPALKDALKKSVRQTGEKTDKSFPRKYGVTLPPTSIQHVR